MKSPFSVVSLKSVMSGEDKRGETRDVQRAEKVFDSRLKQTLKEADSLHLLNKNTREQRGWTLDSKESHPRDDFVNSPGSGA